MAWIRFFDTQNSSRKIEVKGKSFTLDEALSKLHSPRREERKEFALAIDNNLKEKISIFSYIFNTILQERKIEDKLRHFKEPITFRNLSNEIDDSTVSLILSLCQKEKNIVIDYYKLKSKVLGIKLKDYDRYAPIFSKKKEENISFQKAKKITLEAFGEFSPDFAETASLFFKNQWIDSQPKEGKATGAFCYAIGPHFHPFISLNYTGKQRDILTLAHELGHGIHYYLARKNGYLRGFFMPIITAEVASTFAEMLVFDYLLERKKSKREKINLISQQLEEIFATIFRQAIMTEFEKEVHNLRRKKGELGIQELNKIWLEKNRLMFGKSVTLRKEYGFWWSYIPHFIQSPFYCYGYSFSDLLTLSLYQKYLKEGKPFVKKYIALLYAGGSDWPEKLLKETVGFDIKKESSWEEGFRFLKEKVKELHSLFPGKKGKKLP